MRVAEPLIQTGLVGEAIENGPAMVLIADEDMRYVAANVYACEQLGYTRAELLGLRVTDVARYESARTEYRELLKDGSHAGRTTIARKDGTTFEFEYRARETTIAGVTFYVSVGWPA